MQIFLSPEVMKEEGQIVNIIDSNAKAIGYLTIFFDEKKMYVFGQCKEESVSADFKDLLKPYVQGMAKAKPDLEVYSYISIGGEKMEFDVEEGKKS